MSWLGYRLLEFAVAMVIVVSVLYASDRVRNRYREAVAADTWFKVNEIFVPDHAKGSNPTMIYDRRISEPFQAFWVVEVHRRENDGLFSLACQGSDVNDYDPSDYIPDNKVTWQWFIGRPCAVRPGEYRLRASWTMKRPGWPEKSVVAYSNIFRVTP